MGSPEIAECAPTARIEEAARVHRCSWDSSRWSHLAHCVSSLNSAQEPWRAGRDPLKRSLSIPREGTGGLNGTGTKLPLPWPPREKSPSMLSQQTRCLPRRDPMPFSSWTLSATHPHSHMVQVFQRPCHGAQVQELDQWTRP